MARTEDKTSPFCGFLRPHFETVLPNFFVLFSTLKSRMSRNMCKLLHKAVRNCQNLHYESPNFRNYFVLSETSSIIYQRTTLPRNMVLTPEEEKNILFQIGHFGAFLA